MKGAGRRREGRGMGRRQRGPGRRMRREQGCSRLNVGSVARCGPLKGFLPTALMAPETFPHPSPFAARVDPDRCVACGTCEEVCPVGAISVGDIAWVDPALCVGCGLCIDECPQGALSLDARRPVRKQGLERTG